ncbi:MAG: hypothetical protein MJ168_12075 [Clostridia bacterium]|nr:hypothetical protein [Clostridia bacterium]
MNNSSVHFRRNNPPLRKGASYHWKTENVRYDNFTDLGRYIIDCYPHKNFCFQKALDYCNKRYDLSRMAGCSALATRTNSGDVIIGRNLDLTVSQFPCYISHVRFGKYETLNFSYDELFTEGLRYSELLCAGKIDDEYFNALPMLASDSMNSEGLYLEYNMRAYEEQFICMGTNPDAKTRICSISLPFVVASYCATVDEAVRFMREQLDIYTLIDESIASGWNLCFAIGDARGNYGIIEIANNEIKYLPHANGQGNYYIYPEFNSTSQNQSGYGRLQFGLERIDKVQCDKDMTELMEAIMWRNEILDIPFAYRDTYGHIHFCDNPEHTHESLDWRSDNVKRIPVNSAGRYVDIDDDTREAIQVRGYKQCYDDYLAGIHTPTNKEGYECYLEYLNRCDLVWVQTNDNFEDLQKGLMKHYIESGAVEKLRLFYSGIEKPLRDDGNIFTTALSFSVNCTKKRLTVKFWEQPDLVFHYQW